AALEAAGDTQGEREGGERRAGGDEQRPVPEIAVEGLVAWIGSGQGVARRVPEHARDQGERNGEREQRALPRHLVIVPGPQTCARTSGRSRRASPIAPEPFRCRPSESPNHGCPRL